MSETGPEGLQNSMEAALARLVDGGDHLEFLQALAGSEVLLPQPEGHGEQTVLPIMQEQDGQQFIPAFTSTERLAEAGLAGQEVVAVGGAELGAHWPADPLPLTLNPGSEISVAVPPEAMRALPNLLGS